MADQKNKKTRRRKTKSYKHFKLSKKIKPSGQPLPGVFSLLKNSLGLLRAHKRLFVGIIVIHSLLSLFFVAGLGSSFDFVQTKRDLEDVLGGEVSQATTTLALFGYLLGSAGVQASEVAGTYQMFLTLITSLAIIWGVRQIMAGELVSARDVYYRGLYPLVPLLLVLFVIGLQLIPALIGTGLYSIVLDNGLAVTAIEKGVWLLLFVLSWLLSLYMVASSIFAVYIVTLPDMTPIRALRSARALVLHRRFNIGLRVIALPLLLLVLGMVILAPAILFLPWLAIGMFLIYSSFCLCLGHTYMYNLYRSMLNE